jgi:hypothetical protein
MGFSSLHAAAHGIFVPQLPQNLTPGGTVVLQLGHAEPSRFVPQLPQNFVPGALGWPHLGQGAPAGGAGAGGAVWVW